MSSFKSPKDPTMTDALIPIIFLVILLIDRIEFPFPNKDIQKIIPDEKLKIVK